MEEKKDHKTFSIELGFGSSSIVMLLRFYTADYMFSVSDRKKTRDAVDKRRKKPSA